MIQAEARRAARATMLMAMERSLGVLGGRGEEGSMSKEYGKMRDSSSRPSGLA
jgi:hypothetical protein